MERAVVTGHRLRCAHRCRARRGGHAKRRRGKGGRDALVLLRACYPCFSKPLFRASHPALSRRTLVLWYRLVGGFISVGFRIGDKVVYPHHGAATIEPREKKELFGEKREYFILKLAYGELPLMVPIDATEEVGLRPVPPAKEVPKVLKVLKKNEPTTNTTNWSRRFKANVEKLRSGDIYQVADVVRSLHQRDKEKGLAAGEKRMLTKARQILVSELTFSKNCKEEDAEKMLDEVLG